MEDNPHRLVATLMSQFLTGASDWFAKKFDIGCSAACDCESSGRLFDLELATADNQAIRDEWTLAK